MDTLSRNNNRHLIKAGSAGFFCGLVVWTALLVSSARQLRGATNVAHTTVHVAGLRLTEISKQTSSQAQTLRLHFYAGFLWFLAGAMILGIATSWLYGRHISHSDNNSP